MALKALRVDNRAGRPEIPGVEVRGLRLGLGEVGPGSEHGADLIQENRRPLRGPLPKATDVYPDTRRLTLQAGGRHALENAFPVLQSAEVLVEHTLGWAMTYDETQIGEWMNCPVRQCDSGGFNLGFILWKMTSDNAAHLRTAEACRGHERSLIRDREWSEIVGPCRNIFTITVDLLYKR